MIKEYSDLLKPKKITIVDKDTWVTKEFVITRFGAVKGLEVLSKMPSAVVKSILSGDKQEIDKILALKDDLMPLVFVEGANGKMINLDTDVMIDNHVNGAVALIALGIEVVEYNFSDLGKLVEKLGFLTSITGKVQSFTQNLATALFSPFSKQNKRR